MYLFGPILCHSSLLGLVSYIHLLSWAGAGWGWSWQFRLNLQDFQPQSLLSETQMHATCRMQWGGRADAWHLSCRTRFLGAACLKPVRRYLSCLKLSLSELPPPLCLYVHILLRLRRRRCSLPLILTTPLCSRKLAQPCSYVCILDNRAGCLI